MEKMNSRKEKRKMARQEKKQHKHQALLQHHQKKLCKSKPKPENTKMGGSREGSVKDNVRIENVRGNPCMRESDNDSDREGDYVKPVFKSKMTKRDHINSDSKRTKFEEYLEMDMKVGPSMEEDLEMERRLAKKLKLKKGKLDDGGDELDDLFEGVPPFYHSYGKEYDICDGNEGDGLLESNEKKRKRKKLKKLESIQDYIRIQRRVRGLLNSMLESNLESITGEIFSLFQSVSGAVTSQIISEEVLASCAQGPWGNEQYAAVFAAFVAGMACMIGIDFGARVMESFAKSFEVEFSKEDSISLRNLMLLLSYLCIFGVCSSDLIYDFLIKLTKQLAEIDVSTIDYFTMLWNEVAGR